MTPEDEAAYAASRRRAEAILADPERVELLMRPAAENVTPMTGDEFRSLYLLDVIRKGEA